jgi:membrane protein DedA with SNARE-associated domain
MDLLEQFVGWLQTLSPMGVLALIFFIAWLENVFPPSPSDVVLVFAGTLIGVGTISFFPALIAATLGSTLGFLTAYIAGRYFEQRIVSGSFGRFLPVAVIHKVEGLFQKYGYGVIIANRFLSGTRAVVSFAAGMSKMNPGITTLLCALSALAWNVLLLLLGKSFGDNWRKVGDYLATYGKAVTVIIVVIAIALSLRYWRQKSHQKTES